MVWEKRYKLGVGRMAPNFALMICLLGFYKGKVIFERRNGNKYLPKKGAKRTKA